MTRQAISEHRIKMVIDVERCDGHCCVDAGRYLYRLQRGWILPQKREAGQMTARGPRIGYCPFCGKPLE